MKKVKPTTDYDQLVAFARKAIEGVPPTFKFFYIDLDNDMISISNQDDFQEALENYESQPSLKLIIAETIDEARLGLEQNSSSSIKESMRL